MSKKIYFNYGSGYEDVTQYIRDDLVITERMSTDDYHYAMNVVNMTMNMDSSPEVPDAIGGTYYYKDVDDWTTDDGWTQTLSELSLPTTRGGVYKRDFITISGGYEYIIKLKAYSSGPSNIVVAGEREDNSFEIIGSSLLPGGEAISTFVVNNENTFTGLGFVWDASVNVEWEFIYIGNGLWESNLDKLRNATEVGVKILEGETQVFQGIIVDKPSHTYNGIFENIQISMEATDSIKKLDVSPGELVLRNAKVMDYTDKDNSIVHQLAYNAGLTNAYIGDYIISTTISGFATISGNGSVLSIMDTLLYEHGYVVHMNEYDKIYPIQWIVPSGTSAGYVFTEENMQIELEVNEEEKEYEGVEVTYYNIGEKHNVLLYQDDLPRLDDGEWVGYTIPAGYYYPIEANVINEETGLNEEVFFEYDDTGIKAITNKAIVNNLDYDPRTAMRAFTSDFSDIICTSGWYLEEQDDGLTLITSGFYNNKARIVYKNETAGDLDIDYLNIKGSVLYKTAERTSRVVTVSGTKKIEEYGSSYIYTSSVADALAKAKANVHAVGNVYYTIISEDAITIGAYVQIIADNRTNQYAKILEKRWNEKTKQYTYKCKSYSTNEQVIRNRTTIRNNASPTVDVVSVGLDKYNMTILSDYDGSNPILGDAVITAKVLVNGADDSVNWNYSTSVSGLIGDLVGNVYTISGINSDSGYVDFTFSKTNYTDKILRCTVTRVKQGIVEHVVEILPEITPIYKGRIPYSDLETTVGNTNDRIMAYASTSGECGLYKRSVSTWDKQWPPTTGMISESWPDVIWAVNQSPSYPASGLASVKIQAYTGEGVTYFEMLGANMAFLNSVFAQTITIQSGGYIDTSNYAEDAGGFPVAGYKLPYDGILKAAGAKLDIAEVRGVKWSGPKQVGSGLTITGVSYPALAALNGTDVAFIDSTLESLRVYRWNGSTWAQVGSGLTITGVNYLALAALNGTDVAFIDNSLESLRVYRWNGSAWAQVGSGLTITGAGIPALAALNGTDVAFIDSTLESLRVYRWNGSTWAQVGSELAITGAGTPALAALNGTDVAFIDGSLESLRVYRWNGSTWAQVGSGLTITGMGAPALAALNGTDVAFIDSDLDSLRVYRWNGSTWAKVGSAGNTGISGGNPALAALNGTDVAFIDSLNKSLRAYSFNFALSTPYRPWE